ncbi:MAG: DUF6503 family protein [Verrucomicrobiota bacterium]
MNFFNYTLPALYFGVSALVITGCGGKAEQAEKPAPKTSAQWADHSQRSHGLETWWGKQVVAMDMDVVFGGSPIVDGVFTFEAHGPKAKYEAPEGLVVFDGKEAHVSVNPADWPMARFHVLTWPWFLIAPVKMTGEGIELSDKKYIMLNGKEYLTFKQTFAAGVGDTPDDWYRYFIDPSTGRVEALSYIVTYGKDAEKAEEQPSIVFYKNYQSFDGVEFATKYEFWYWDEKTGKLVGDAPKGEATVNSVTFLESADFAIPEGAQIQALPGS